MVWKTRIRCFASVNFNFSGNDIGGNSVADSIAFVSNSTLPATSAIIYNLGSGQTTIKGNDFKNIHTASLTTPDLSLKIIQNEGNNVIIDSNNVGTNNHALRIVHGGTGLLSGIDTYGGATITNNIITNLMARRIIQGIATANSYGPIANNTVSFIKSYEGDVNQNSFYTVAGIATFSGNHDVSKNKVLQLQDSSLSNSFGRSVAIFVNKAPTQLMQILLMGCSKILLKLILKVSEDLKCMTILQFLPITWSGWVLTLRATQSQEALWLTL